jgi:hypothetical protein
MLPSFLNWISPRNEKHLLALCLNNPNEDKKIYEFNKSAVRFLIRELRRSPKLLNELERAISEKCSDTKCVTIPETSERRLLIAHRRCKPQVIYCRLWRWPDLQSQHQIKCKCPANSEFKNSSAICINPYHYERNISKPIDPVLVPCSKIPPDLSTSFEDSEPRTERTKSRPAELSFIQHLDSYFNQPGLSGPEQPVQSEPSGRTVNLEPLPEILTSDSIPCDSEADYTMVTTGELGAEQALETYNGTYTHTATQLSTNLSPESGSLSSPQQQQQFYQQQTSHAALATHQPSQGQETQFQSASGSQQQYLQSQANLSAAPYQLQALDPLSRSQEKLFQKHQQSYVSSSARLQYPPDLPHCRIESQTGQQKPIVNRTETARPFRFKSKGFAGRVNQDQTRMCHGLRFDSGSSYLYSSQRAPQQVVYPLLRSTQPTGVGINPMVDTNPDSRPMCSSSISSYSTTSNDTTQQNSHVPIANAEYPTLFSTQQQQQFPAQDQSAQLGYQTDAAMSVAEQQPNTSYYTTLANHGQIVNEDQQMDQSQVIDIQEVPFTDDQFWCSITYHEYDQRIGEKYHSTSRVVSVDGFTQPMCNDRFCIGGISNVNRNQFTEWVRRRIGRGAKLTYVDGDVYVEGISESSIFVSNPLHMDAHKGVPEELVVKLSPGCSTRAFSTHEFGKLMRAAVEEGFEAVYKLTSRCVIRVSFVKGWGKNYKRQSIYNTPCWVEVQLNGPLQWIDKVLRQMRPPMGCGSTS